MCFNFWPHYDVFYKINLPVVILVQDMTFFEFPELLNNGKYLQLWKDVFIQYLDNADVIVTSSLTTRLKIMKIFNSKYNDKISIIRHALFVPFDYDSKLVIPKYETILKKDYLICISNTSFHKNLNLVLESFAFRAKKDFNLVFVGYGTEVLDKSWLQKDALHWVHLMLNGFSRRMGLKLGQNVFGLGVVTDAEKNYLLQHAKALIMPSRGEGGGSYPIEESIYMNIPVLASDIPIIRESMQYHTAKILWFNPYSIDSLNQAIDELYLNYETYKDEVKNDKRLDNLTWKAIGGKYLKIFKKISIDLPVIHRVKKKVELDQQPQVQIEVVPQSEESEIEPQLKIPKPVNSYLRDYLDKILKLVKFITPYVVIKIYLRLRHKE